MLNYICFKKKTFFFITLWPNENQLSMENPSRHLKPSIGVHLSFVLERYQCFDRNDIYKITSNVMYIFFLCLGHIQTFKRYTVNLNPAHKIDSSSNSLIWRLNRIPVTRNSLKAVYWTWNLFIYLISGQISCLIPDIKNRGISGTSILSDLNFV